MKSLRYLLILLLSPALLFAQKAVPLLVNVSYLETHQTDPDVVLLEVNSKKSYEQQHIPGARLITIEDISTPVKAATGQLGLELLPPDVLRSRLEAVGISDASHIIVYSGKDEPFQLTTRVLFVLEYMGLGDRTSLLNGGFASWVREGKPVTSKVSAVTPGKLTLSPEKDLVADASLVRSLAERPAYKLVDARTPNFFNGTEPSFNSSGHIPGAINIPFNQVTEDNSEIDLGHLNQLFSEAGIKPGDTVVTYCHLGAQATATLFAARLLGHPVMLYDGSFQDWATNHRGDVVK
jgi:thiosulfate/3-mercaptopyruvate sulfurtransferase